MKCTIPFKKRDMQVYASWVPCLIIERLYMYMFTVVLTVGICLKLFSAVPQACIAGVASQAGDVTSVLTPGLTSVPMVNECSPWYSIVFATVT